MKKSDNYGSLEAIIYFFTGIASFVIWFKGYGIEFLVYGAFLIILAYISMAITTIKKHIDKTFDDKIRHIDNAEFHLNSTLKIIGVEEKEKENE